MTQRSSSRSSDSWENATLDFFGGAGNRGDVLDQHTPWFPLDLKDYSHVLLFINVRSCQ